MKKLTLALALAALSASLVQAATNTATKATKPRRAHPTWEQRHTGGLVTKPNSAKGKVVFLNAQRRVKEADVAAAVGYIKAEVRPEAAWLDVSAVKVANPRDDIRKAGGNMGVVLVDVPDVPALLAAPEEGWAIVNVAKLADGAKDAASLAKRVRIELMRGFALVAGCAFMAHDQIVMRMNVTIPEDLDMIKHEAYGADVKYAMTFGLPFHGVTPWKVTTYLRACEEGWAAAPTNKYQKALWDKVHAIPQKPMKIEFDPKKGR